MRIELAKLLLQNNDILLLDEPTNHLDIESIIWFESFLRSFAGAVVLVSHDKMFLDNVTNRTIEISLGKIYDFNKPYTQYLVLREEMREMQLAAQKNQAKKIEETEKLIEKFRYKATKASMAQSLIKKLDKIERIEVDEDDQSVMNISFPVTVIPGKVVLEIEKVTKSFGEKVVFKDIDLLVERGDRKSTRLNSSHVRISYAVFCLKKKKKKKHIKQKKIPKNNMPLQSHMMQSTNLIHILMTLLMGISNVSRDFLHTL